MSERFPGGIISKTAPVPTGPYENGAAPGIWTLEQQAEFVKQGIWPIAGNVPNYIEDVFQTWLYTGNGSTQTINNGIDLAGKGGLVWTKSRSVATDHSLVDTARGADKVLHSESTAAQVTYADITAFNSNGYSISDVSGWVNTSPRTYASWTFREQPKFFDVVTYTGNGSGARNISHNLNSAPGCIIVKCTSTTSNWMVWHRSISGQNNLYLNATDGTSTVASDPISVPGFPSSLSTTEFTVSTGTDSCNDNGATYVAYLFAHNAGGFGLTGTDNVISCGSFTTNGSGQATVDLGYEPQWLMYKGSSAVTNWSIADNMRGFVVGAANSGSKYLNANSSSAELDTPPVGITNTGFNYDGAPSTTFIYIAIRRGPMRTPTTGTSVFDPELTAAAAGTTVTTNFPIDLQLYRATGVLDNIYAVDRLRGVNTTAVNTVTPLLFTNTTGAEATDAVTRAWNNTGFQTPLTNGGTSSIYWNFRRAPGFFDEVCYTGTGAAFNNIPHNLNAVPELIITKNRSAGGNWNVYSATVGNTQTLYLNQDFSPATGVGFWNNTSPTSSVFTVGTAANTGTLNYVAYLFASCPGVSKVGSFTGTGATQVINCGFTGGARFVLIKATSTTGNWLVWDSARGIVAGNDPYLALNSTAAEVTNTDWVDTAASGFELSNAGGNLANSNGVSYIFLAIA